MPFDLPFWRQWEGQPADAVFPLEYCTYGDDREAVFDTQFESKPATIKLVMETVPIEELQLRWEKAAGLAHPALVPILAHGETTLDDLLCAYVVTPRADESLAEALEEMPLTAAQALDSLEPVMSALQYLESKGLAPRELRPSSIMAFGDQIRISSDDLVDSATDSGSLLRALGLLIEKMLQDDAKSSPLPQPFAEIVRNCRNPDPQDPWDLTRVQARLFPTATIDPASPEPFSEPTPARTPRLWWSAALAATVVVAMAGYFFWPSSPRQANASPPQTSGPPREFAMKSEPTAPPPIPASSPAPAPLTSDSKKPVKEEAVKVLPPVVELKPARKQEPKATEPTAVPPEENTPVEKTPKVRTKTVNGMTQVLPEIPKALRDRIPGQVRLNVLVRSDSSGRVVEATPQPPAVSQYYTARATAAAQAWKFPPPENNATQDWVLRFEFTRENTRVSVGRLSP